MFATKKRGMRKLFREREQQSVEPFLAHLGGKPRKRIRKNMRIHFSTIPRSHGVAKLVDKTHRE